MDTIYSIRYPSGNEYVIKNIKLSLFDTITELDSAFGKEIKGEKDSNTYSVELELYENYIPYILRREIPPMVDRKNDEKDIEAEEFHNALCYFGDEELLHKFYNNFLNRYIDSYKAYISDPETRRFYMSEEIDEFLIKIIAEETQDVLIHINANISEDSYNRNFNALVNRNKMLVCSNMPENAFRIIGTVNRNERHFWYKINCIYDRPMFIEKYIEHIPKGTIYNFSSDLEAEKYIEYVDWSAITSNPNISEAFLQKYISRIGGIESWIDCRNNLDLAFLEKNKKIIAWDRLKPQINISIELLNYLINIPKYRFHVSKYPNLPIYFIRENINKIDWSCLSRHYRIDEQFYEEFRKRIYHSFVSWENSLLSFEFTRIIFERIKETGFSTIRRCLFMNYKDMPISFYEENEEYLSPSLFYSLNNHIDRYYVKKLIQLDQKELENAKKESQELDNTQEDLQNEQKDEDIHDEKWESIWVDIALNKNIKDLEIKKYAYARAYEISPEFVTDYYMDILNRNYNDHMSDRDFLSWLDSMPQDETPTFLKEIKKVFTREHVLLNIASV